jgi:uncharacterized protein (DUF3820 family)
MADIVQNFLDWFSQNQGPLGKIGAALVIIIGGLWQLYVFLDAKRDRLTRTGDITLTQ